jgi:hypothetical protein
MDDVIVAFMPWGLWNKCWLREKVCGLINGNTSRALPTSRCVFGQYCLPSLAHLGHHVNAMHAMPCRSAKSATTRSDSSTDRKLAVSTYLDFTGESSSISSCSAGIRPL